MRRDAFVATATATGLIVDIARMPVYVWTQGNALAAEWRPILLASVGVLVGTVVGARVLRRIPEEMFRRMVAVLLVGLGLATLIASWRSADDFRSLHRPRSATVEGT